MRLRKIETPQIAEAMPTVRAELFLRDAAGDAVSTGDDRGDSVMSASGRCRRLRWIAGRNTTDS